MTQTITYDGSSLTTAKRTSFRFVESAKLGEVGMGIMSLDDAAGALTPVGLKTVIVTQDAAPSNSQRVFTGRAASRHFKRGEFPVGAGREIDIDLLDANVLAGDHVITGTDGNRASESISARLTWLLGSTYVAFHDNGQVLYPSTTMDANDYRGQTPGDVLFDCANQGNAGYNWFIYYDEAHSQYSLFFNNSNTASSSTYASTAKISNVAADIDGTTVFAPFMDAELHRDPAKVASGVYVPYAKGATYRTLSSTATAFTSRDMVATTSNVKTLSRAQALGDRLLADNATEDDTITCSIKVLPANVNDIRAGHLLQAKFSHLPSYTSYSYFRVLRRTVSQPHNTDNEYQIDLELSPASPSNPTYTFAIVDRGYVQSSGPYDTPPVGTYEMGYSYTGDAPAGAYPSQPKTGSVAYKLGGAGGAINIGFTLSGGGTLTCTAQTKADLGYQSATGNTYELQILKNGTMALSSGVITDTGTGIHLFVADVAASGTVTVVSTDVLTTAFIIGGSNCQIGSVPIAGTFGPPYSFSIEGYLS